jgi:cytochrome c
MYRCLLTAVAVFALAIQGEAADEDLELSFNDHCRECHSFLKDDNRLGPSLYGVVGRKAGTEPGFSYSTSLKDSGVTWSPATLEKWITNPQAVIPGNAMSPPFPGVADPKIRAKIIAFLETLRPHDSKAEPAP